MRKLKRIQYRQGDGVRAKYYREIDKLLVFKKHGTDRNGKGGNDLYRN